MARYECRICGERSDDKGRLIDHVDSKHSIVPWFVEIAINEVEERR